MTRKLLIGIILMTLAIPSHAQVTTAMTVYREFQPATVYLADGRKLRLSLANIFLKNSSLLYKSGIETKEANLKTLNKVEFKDKTYFKIDTLLACQIDTVGQDALFRARKIDYEAWKHIIANNQVMTSLDLGDMIGYSLAELTGEQDMQIPLMTLYYYRLNGKFVLVHERNLKRMLTKEKKRLMESVMAEEGFSWTDEQSLLRLLKMIR